MNPEAATPGAMVQGPERRIQERGPEPKRRDEEPSPTRRPGAEEIARRAYELYESRGRSHGRTLDDWLEAERELMRTKGE